MAKDRVSQLEEEIRQLRRARDSYRDYANKFYIKCTSNPKNPHNQQMRRDYTDLWLETNAKIQEKKKEKEKLRQQKAFGSPDNDWFNTTVNNAFERQSEKASKEREEKILEEIKKLEHMKNNLPSRGHAGPDEIGTIQEEINNLHTELESIRKEQEEERRRQQQQANQQRNRISLGDQKPGFQDLHNGGNNQGTGNTPQGQNGSNNTGYSNRETTNEGFTYEAGMRRGGDKSNRGRFVAK